MWFTGYQNNMDVFYSDLTNSSNSSSDLEPDGDTFSLSLGVQVILSSLLLVSIPEAVVGNGIMCSMVFRKSSMKSGINLLMAHHALGSILLSICCGPFVFVSITMKYWPFGGFLCDIIAFLQMTFSGVITLFLTVISIDRYFILVQRKDILHSDRTYKLILLLWILCGLSSLPPLFGLGNYSEFSGWPQCILGHMTSPAGEVYSLFLMTLIYYMPAVLMAYCYVVIMWRVRHNNVKIHEIPDKPEILVSSGKNPPLQIDISFKTKTFRALFIIYLIWLLATCPYSVCWLVWNSRRNVDENVVAGSILLVLGYLNCCTPPVVYYYKVYAYQEYCQSIWSGVVNSLCLNAMRLFGQRRVNPASLYEVR